jgi:large subunit ribosomal protein L21
MEAIVKISGKQYRVAEGARFVVDRLASGVGDEVSFGEVLLLSDGAKAIVGTPNVDGAAVTARVVAATRGAKLIVYKYKAKKRYRRTQGARADQSLLEILTVKGPGSKAKPAKADVKTPDVQAKPARAEKLAAEPAKAAKPQTAKPKAEKPKAEKPKAEKPKAEKPKAEKPAELEGD